MIEPDPQQRVRYRRELSPGAWLGWLDDIPDPEEPEDELPISSASTERRPYDERRTQAGTTPRREGAHRNRAKELKVHPLRLRDWIAGKEPVPEEIAEKIRSLPSRKERPPQ